MSFDTAFYLSFFKKELKDNLLSFWMSRCLDTEYGGYLNCFTNAGDRLVSYDKYTWSQGRFLWTFSKLASCKTDAFKKQERERFLEMAKNGRDFLLKNVLIAPGDLRCVFLMERDGTPKYVEGCKELDMSISADCFVVMGFAKYAEVSGDEESYLFAKALFGSVWERYQSGNFKSLPYPISPKYQSHARPMILTNVICELFGAASRFDTPFLSELKEKLLKCHREVFEVFCDKDNLVHEFRLTGGDFPPNLFGGHINPGHTLEDMWFQTEAQEILGIHTYDEKIRRVVESTFRTGWDKEYGGLLHFVTCDGKGMTGKVGDAADEPQMKLVLDDWGSKLWWVHSEALYTTLLTFDRTGDEAFQRDFETVFDYTFRTFPNPDRSIGEWIQIRTREGHPQEKVVALPVKDPYHIIRNVVLIIELLEKRIGR
ncbi:MAG: AGE family epimerase/isomerase [Clostridia bacterium]|nr:AGE family epimerase/isomerase [Clostridia bacterium]